MKPNSKSAQAHRAASTPPVRSRRPESETQGLSEIRVAPYGDGAQILLKHHSGKLLLNLDRVAVTSWLEMADRKLKAASGLSCRFQNDQTESVEWSAGADDALGVSVTPREIRIVRAGGRFYLHFTEQSAEEAPFVRFWIGIATLRALFWELRELHSLRSQLGTAPLFFPE